MGFKLFLRQKYKDKLNELSRKNAQLSTEKQRAREQLRELQKERDACKSSLEGKLQAQRERGQSLTETQEDVSARALLI